MLYHFISNCTISFEYKFTIDQLIICAMWPDNAIRRHATFSYTTLLTYIFNLLSIIMQTHQSLFIHIDSFWTHHHHVLCHMSSITIILVIGRLVRNNHVLMHGIRFRLFMVTSNLEMSIMVLRNDVFRLFDHHNLCSFCLFVWWFVVVRCLFGTIKLFGYWSHLFCLIGGVKSRMILFLFFIIFIHLFQTRFYIRIL